MSKLSHLWHPPIRPPRAGEASLAHWRDRIMDRMLQAGALLGLLAEVPSLLTVVYLIALALLLHPASAGAGLLWIMALPVLTALFLDLRAALGLWLLALATIAACGGAMALGWIGLPSPSLMATEALAGWLVTASSALFLSALIALPSAMLLRGLEQTHRALSREQERFARVFQLCPEPIAINRLADGRFLDVNRAWTGIFGWTRDEALGRTRGELGFLPADGVGMARMEAELAATGQLLPRTLDLTRRDGSPLPVLMTAKVLDLDGEACVLSLAQDLSPARATEAERRRLESELQHAQKLESMGSLAGGVAHDMNNILVGILGLTSMLEQVHAGDPALSKALDGIHRAGERGRKLVRSLTDFARKGLDDARPVDLNELVASELDLLASTTRHQIELVRDLDPELPRVLGEPAALNTAIMNLCVNALDAMPEGGTLRLQTRVGPGGRVEVRVGDTGQGMAPAVLARAMEPFFTTKPPGKGTGLGLPGVYGTMKAHGGSVELQSEPGRGTMVLLRFPRYAPEEPTPVAASEPAPPSGLEALSILVVDDDVVIQETLPSLLGFLGHRCSLAARGQEALDLLATGLELDLVILDHNMPGLTGAETLVRLRALRPELPVLLSTGFLEPEVEAVVLRYPKVSLLYKPYSLGGIRRKLDELRLASGGPLQ